MRFSFSSVVVFGIITLL
jgi:hypothetical protein